MTKIYFAGPDVFYPDYETHIAKIKQLCMQSGVEAIFPTDNLLDSSQNKVSPLSEQIFYGNLGMIKQADAVIANLNPFRSTSEPDSGTAFECGLAFAYGKKLIAYIDDRRTLVEKIGQSTDENNASVEDFNLPLNLMLAHGCDLVKTVEEAIVQLANKINKS